MKQTEFKVKPLGKKQKYYGFSLGNNPLYQMPNGEIFHNSGKSVSEQAIVGHVSRYENRYQLVGVN